jgi:hypothetical protein
MSDPKTSIASYAASGSLVIFGMSANDFAVMIGLVLAVATFLLNWIYKHRHFKLIERQVNGMPFPKLDMTDET